MAKNFRGVAQRVIYSALNGNVSGFNVYSHVPFEPEGAPDDKFPYVLIGDADVEPWDTDSTLGAYVNAEIHVFSRYKGRKEVNAGMDAVYVLLHRATLSSAGYRFVDSLFMSSFADRLEDGITSHGIITFRLTIQEA